MLSKCCLNVYDHLQNNPNHSAQAHKFSVEVSEPLSVQYRSDNYCIVVHCCCLLMRYLLRLYSHACMGVEGSGRERGGECGWEWKRVWR